MQAKRKMQLGWNGAVSGLLFGKTCLSFNKRAPSDYVFNRTAWVTLSNSPWYVQGMLPCRRRMPYIEMRLLKVHASNFLSPLFLHQSLCLLLLSVPSHPKMFTILCSFTRFSSFLSANVPIKFNSSFWWLRWRNVKCLKKTQTFRVYDLQEWGKNRYKVLRNNIDIKVIEARARVIACSMNVSTTA